MQKMLAAPSATSSALELWLSPLMPSTTVALKSDSTPARKAMVRPLGSTLSSKLTEMSGIFGIGRKCGTPPNLLPMVSMLRPKTATSSVAPVTQTR